MKNAVVVISVAMLLGFASGAQAKKVTVSGCAEAGVEKSCVVLKSGKKLYNITHATPAPTVGTYGTVTGTVSRDVDPCQQGTILKPAKWKPDPKKVCANNK
ncbi:hypothetical protein [Mesorhizobium huakuii]|uniref:Uncharacterized protein n=1 Tax=Mesorhizobium huakuii TaxID=28104 RepID=A0A7G6SVR5_9HYPH|nr:hypothetical protein [Mesorhizobium huakuii]QND58597.1 hypothetical protein HB778_19850 [Mesorhizobium huakuii]